MADRTCSIAGCARKVKARGWCVGHYERWRLGMDMETPIHKAIKVCAVNGCRKPHSSHGFCTLHVSRWRNHGDPLWVPPVITSEQRFWPKVEKTESCWLWRGQRDRKGYGLFRKASAHRFSYQLAYGSVPSILDHICRNPSCVRPDHLRPATRKQNAENHSGPNATNKTSGVRGVSWHKRTRKWMVQVRHNGQAFYCGLYSSLAAAEAAAIAKRNELWTYNELDRTA